MRNHKNGIDERGYDILGNPSSFYGNGIIAYLDLLGFANVVLSSWGESEDSPLARLLRIKDSIPNEKDQVLHVSCDSEGKPQFVYRCKVRTISDSIIIFTALPENLTYGDLCFSFMSILTCVRDAWIQCIKEGFTIRGAIEFGKLFWDDNEIAGPAYVDTYYLESNEAKSSRVILGPFYTKAIVSAAKTVDIMVDPYSPVPFLCKNKDSMISISPRILMKNKSEHDEFMLQKIKIIQNSCSDSSIKFEKYNELISYLEQPDTIRKANLNDLISYSKAFNR